MGIDSGKNNKTETGGAGVVGGSGGGGVSKER